MPPAAPLADELIAQAREGLEQEYFVSGGSEAVEASLKIARQFFLERGEHGRRRFIARRQSYHGSPAGPSMARRRLPELLGHSGLGSDHRLRYRARAVAAGCRH